VLGIQRWTPVAAPLSIMNITVLLRSRQRCVTVRSRLHLGALGGSLMGVGACSPAAPQGGTAPRCIPRHRWAGRRSPAVSLKLLLWTFEHMHGDAAAAAIKGPAGVYAYRARHAVVAARLWPASGTSPDTSWRRDHCWRVRHRFRMPVAAVFRARSQPFMTSEAT
jgi:hypothetical protein